MQLQKEIPFLLSSGDQASLNVHGDWADWVEEAQSISNQMGCSFHHVLREANGIADGLATAVICLLCCNKNFTVIQKKKEVNAIFLTANPTADTVHMSINNGFRE